MGRSLIGIKELAVSLGLSVNTVYSWVWQERIPCYKLGSRVMFDPNEIDRWLQERKREANPKWEVADG